MDETRTPGKRRALKIVGWIFGILFILLILVYFVATSEAMFKKVILPKVGKAMDADVTVADASISPFSKVVLQDFKLAKRSGEMTVTAKEVRARYSLWKIISGTILVEEAALISPVIEMVQGPAEPSQPPSTEGDTGKRAPEGKPAPTPQKKEGKPTQIDVKKVVLENGTIRIVQKHKGGSQNRTELTGVNVNLQNLKNGQTGTLELAAALAMEQNPPGATNSSLAGKINGNFKLALTPDLKPGSIQGESKLEVQQAGGGLADLSGLNAIITCDVLPTEIKGVALRLQKGNNLLSEIRASGPFDIEKTEGRINVQIASIDRQLLNLAGAASGIDFGSTTINSTNQIDIAQAGKQISAGGQMTIAKFSITKTNVSTPPLDLVLGYQVAVNQNEQAAVLQAINLNGRQRDKQLLVTELTSPMKISWGNSAAPAGDATLKLALTGLNLADWKALAGEAAPEGVVNANGTITSKQAGKLLEVNMRSEITGLAVTSGSNNIRDVNLSIDTQAAATELNQVNLAGLKLGITHKNQPVLSAQASGNVDLKATNANLQLTADGSFPGLLAMLGRPDMTATSGALLANTKINRKGESQSVSGSMTISNLTGTMGNSKFRSYTAGTDLDVAMEGQKITIRKCAGAIKEGNTPGGTFDVSGDYALDKKAGALKLQLTDLNQNALRPFLEPALGDKKLVTVSVNASATAQLAGENDASVKGDFQLAKLVVNDPTQKIPATPLEARLQLDSSMKNKVLELRQCGLTLTPTQRAKNELQVKGKVDMTVSNAITGGVKMEADSLDVTTYYDLFTAKAEQAAPVSPAPSSPKPGTPAPSPAPPGPGTTPPPATSNTNTLPFRNFAAEMNVGRFYLREIEITNMNTAVKLDGGAVIIDPLQLVINGAPIKGGVNLNMAVPGYQYAVNLNADRIPLEPLANTFMPDKKGMYKGDLLANVNIKGIGTDGPALRKTLGGQLGFTFTNANVQIASPKLRSFLGPVAALLNIPELLDTPLNWVGVDTQIGNGTVSFKQLAMLSPVFSMSTGGEMQLADVLTNSTFKNLPVSFAISQSVAQKVRLVSNRQAGPGGYVQLPNFLRVAGTLGKPKPDIDEKALAGAGLQEALKRVPGLDEKTGGLIGQFGGALLGGKTTNAPPPGVVATNKPAATNTAPPAANTNKPSVGTLLDQFLKPKK